MATPLGKYGTKKSKIMKLLITGFEGYIGTRLTRSAIKVGHDVTGLDVGFYRDGNLGGGIENPPTIIHKDIRSISAEDLGGFDAVIHLRAVYMARRMR